MRTRSPLRSHLLALGLLSFGHAHAQVQTYQTATMPTSVAAMLGGANVTITAAQLMFDPMAFALFQDSTASLGLDSGVVLATGTFYVVNGPNFIPDASFGSSIAFPEPDLLQLGIPSTMTFDVAVLKLDLVPWGDTLFIRYVFGSEEYDEYVCSVKDDRVGIFLAGPDSLGPFANNAANIALLPLSGLPVRVNTVNRGQPGTNGYTATCALNPGWLLDTACYINNDFGTGTQMDAYSVVLEGFAVVTPGVPYQLKIAIADMDDGNFDSAVFLGGGSVRCSDLATAVPAPDGPGRVQVWYDGSAGAIHLLGLNERGGTVQVRVFDPAGRLVAMGDARQQGSRWSLPVGVAQGVLIVQAMQDGTVVAGRTYVP
jgi:hypothetical protein